LRTLPQIAKICSKCKRTTEGGRQQCNYHLKISRTAHRNKRIREKKALEDAQRADAQNHKCFLPVEKRSLPMIA
jgi:hypothetical protein